MSLTKPVVLLEGTKTERLDRHLHGETVERHEHALVEGTEERHDRCPVLT